jgi:hypothetical protein
MLKNVERHALQCGRMPSAVSVKFHVNDRAWPSRAPAIARYATVSERANLFATLDPLPDLHRYILEVTENRIAIELRMVYGHSISAGLWVRPPMGNDDAIGWSDNVFPKLSSEIDP